MSFINQVVDYFRSSKNELTKVTWPTRQETIRYSALVIAISLGIAVFFGLLDMGLSDIVTASLANKQISTTPQTEQQAAPVVPTTEPSNPTDQTQPKTQPSINFDQVTPITTPVDKNAPGTKQ